MRKDGKKAAMRTYDIVTVSIWSLWFFMTPKHSLGIEINIGFTPHPIILVVPVNGCGVVIYLHCWMTVWVSLKKQSLQIETVRMSIHLPQTFLKKKRGGQVTPPAQALRWRAPYSTSKSNLEGYDLLGFTNLYTLPPPKSKMQFPKWNGVEKKTGDLSLRWFYHWLRGET